MNGSDGFEGSGLIACISKADTTVGAGEKERVMQGMTGGQVDKCALMIIAVASLSVLLTHHCDGVGKIDSERIWDFNNFLVVSRPSIAS